MLRDRFEGKVSDGTQRFAVALVGAGQSVGNEIVLDDGKLGPEVRAATRLSRTESVDAIVTMGATMQPVVQRIANAARSAAPLLLIGEAGSGKGAIARLVHELSPRADMPFVRLDCGAISASEFEAELVGFKRIAVTGATRDREGLLQAANKGTLLLENVDAIAMSFHSRLEEILSSGEVRRLGDRWNPRLIDVRVIATAGSANILKCTPGNQRSALYDRLSVLSFEVPSLCDRADDLLPLIEHFGRVSTDGVGVEFDDAVLAMFKTYSWPGNIRELQNAVECGVVLGDGKCIRLGDLPVAIQELAKETSCEGESVQVVEACGGEDEAIERRCIVEAMKKTGADRNAVARLLGMTRRTLAYRIALYGLDVELGELAALPG
jgi:DNA-binding NtrC family response regulator